MWETYDSEDFHLCCFSVCSPPQVEAALYVNPGLNLLLYDICLILRRFKRLLLNIIW